jgi:hypothetical protein
MYYISNEKRIFSSPSARQIINYKQNNQWLYELVQLSGITVSLNHEDTPKQ